MVRMIIFDMDGVLFEHTNFWLELHKAFGTLEEGKRLTEQYLYSDYDKLVQEVVGRLWKGKNATVYHNLVKSINYLPGVHEVFAEIKKQDWITAIISSGSIDLARRAQHDLGIDHIYANELVIKDNIVTGEFIQPLGAGSEKKAQIIHHLCSDLGINAKDIIYIGDDKSDIEAFKIVGKAIAFNSTSEELKKAAHHIVEGNDLRKVLQFIGD